MPPTRGKPPVPGEEPCLNRYTGRGSHSRNSRSCTGTRSHSLANAMATTHGRQTQPRMARRRRLQRARVCSPRASRHDAETVLRGCRRHRGRRTPRVRLGNRPLQNRRIAGELPPKHREPWRHCGGVDGRHAPLTAGDVGAHLSGRERPRRPRGRSG